MATQEAVEETRRLLGLGNEQILRVTPENFDISATEAWPPFRRGVVRAEGCREVPPEELLRPIEGKAQVLAFLGDFAERKRGYRRQVENVLRILLKYPDWLEAARADPALVARLPGDEVAEMLAAVPADGGPATTGPAAQARAEAASLAVAMADQRTRLEMTRTQSQDELLRTLRSSFGALVEPGSAAKLDEAVPEIARFGKAVADLLERSVAADVEVLASLEPKAPLLRLLCALHEKRRSERSRVTRLLFSLLETAELAPWRAAADADAALQAELEGLGVLDHTYSNEVASNSGDEEKGPSEARSTASCGKQAMWMWRDAGTYGGWFTHKLATLNPTRWSAPCSLEETIADLEQYLDTPSGERPLKVRVWGGGSQPTSSKAATVAGAVQALRMLL